MFVDQPAVKPKNTSNSRRAQMKSIELDTPREFDYADGAMDFN